MKNEVLKLYEEQGLEAALAFLREQEDVLVRLDSWGALARSIYSDQRDVTLMVSVFEQAIVYGEDAANGASDLEEKIEIQAKIKGLYYDLSANTWPGWGDEGIVIAPEEMAVGYEAAEKNLAWAEKLRKAHIPMGRAYWLMAAHKLAAGKYEDACEDFGVAAKYSRYGGAEGEALLSEGFFAVTLMVSGKEAGAGLVNAKEALALLEHGDFFIGQLDAALEVFK